jgi:transaldolase / glucose-6-phosphate isomerase
MDPLRELARLGQSLWLDSMSRELVSSGELARRIEEDGLCGATSNPSIFEKAIARDARYAAAVEELLGSDPRASDMRIYESLVVRDIQQAADELARVYERTDGRDGFVSLEVTLNEGRDRGSICREARRLWRAVARKNVMIKVPGSDEGLAAFETLIGEGLSINVTLLFGVETYEEFARTYLAGLEELDRRGGDLGRAASVASFFVSRIDTAVDKLLEERASQTQRAGERALLLDLRGRVAIANAKVAFARYRELVEGPRWRALAAKGARTQRLLWASTSTKNPRYRDTLYMEELIGPDTVDTAPPETIDAFRDHGQPRASLEEELDRAPRILRALSEQGIDLPSVTDRLLDEGLKQFEDAFDRLLATIEKERRAPGRARTP